MCSVKPSAQEGSAAGCHGAAEHAGAVMPCPFCGCNGASSIEIDTGRWAVCCGWCDAIGPRGRSIRLAVARWNATLERPDLRPSVPEGCPDDRAIRILDLKVLQTRFTNQE